jgi:CBS domain-containing protein
MSGTSSPPDDPGHAASKDEIVEIEPGPGEPPPVPRRRSDAAPAPVSVTTDIPPRAWPPKVLADLMTRKVMTLDENEPIGELEAWMKRFHFHHLPVVGADMQFVGLITRTDLLHAALGTTHDGKDREPAGLETRAGEIMRTNVVTGRLDSPLTTALRVMLSEKLTCLPVILEDRTLVGIVTSTDFARLALELLERQG